MRLLVCGNRDWACVKTIDAWMRAVLIVSLRKGDEEFVLLHGDAIGADTIAWSVWGTITRIIPESVREISTINVCNFPVTDDEWKTLGKRAGVLRNQRMFDEGKPTRCLAFGRLEKPDGSDNGTGNMVKICNHGGIIVTVVPRPGVMP